MAERTTRPTPRQVTGPAPQRYRGERLGLPESGHGSIAPFGRRALAFVLDLLVSGLVAGLFVGHSGGGVVSHLPGDWSILAFFVDYVVGILLLGRSFGMWVTGLRLIRVDRQVPVGPLRAAARTILLFLLIPAVVFDVDLRGLHDRWTATAVIVH